MESRTYKIKKDSLLEALEDIDRFIDKLEEVEEKYDYKKYSYTIGVDPIEKGNYSGMFEVIVNLTKHEKTN